MAEQLLGKWHTAWISMDVLPVHDRADNTTRCSAEYEISQVANRRQ